MTLLLDFRQLDELQPCPQEAFPAIQSLSLFSLPERTQ
jgi:hypothetical protein